MNIPPLHFSEEEMLERMKELYQLSGQNPENMSYWLPKIQASTSKKESQLQIPKTKIIPLDFETWKWLRSGNYTEEKISLFNDKLVKKLDGFLENEILFMKTGVFSDKFVFSHTTIKDRTKIGVQFLDMYYNSMLLGADQTSEAIFRQMIEDKEGRKQIYEGMPLHTEFRIFYDFDERNVVGISNYWHPELMQKYLSGKDLIYYVKERELLIADFDKYKEKIMEEVHLFMKGCSELTGKWSVDVMKNGNDLWLIDMARMERSALIEYMEEAE
ncbi:hypothetical protein [Virgibacillus halodenitrificans]|uniref:hypothetical protein n=1 Tax=Virgibacillus halodenitrificans TaxID=1482 RepID=UPI000EF55B6B|nr:hypothetical protein [Virgibacillus halodenitrificans]